MWRRMSQLAAIMPWAAVATVVVDAGCAPLATQPAVLPAGPVSGGGGTGGFGQLMAELNTAVPNTAVLTSALTPDTCGPADASVVRAVFPERVLFAFGSDEPVPGAANVIDLLAQDLQRDAPGSEVTVLGHTDAVGSDSYNMDLSRRRAVRVLHALAARGLDPARLSAVAIGKRQPIASNDTADGRSRNRRVEFLISGCLAANLNAVRAQASQAGQADVIRLDPNSAYDLVSVGRVSLLPLSGDQVVPATLAPVAPPQAPVLQPPASLARPAPAPHYQPKTLSPAAQPNPLGPAVPY
jgi:outer membrane protein OmpA-like peptidoglycan-associated protein